MNHQEKLESYLNLNREWHVVERLSARWNQRLHLRHDDWGRPRLAGRGQKIYQVALDLRRSQYVVGRGKKSAAHSWVCHLTHVMHCCESNWNEGVKSKDEAAAEETRTAGRRKGILSKIHRRGPQDKTEV